MTINSFFPKTQSPRSNRVSSAHPEKLVQHQPTIRQPDDMHHARLPLRGRRDSRVPRKSLFRGGQQLTHALPQLEMTSRRKVDANRRNGAKSQGPKTSEGKAASSRNAWKHGLLPRTVRTDDHEAFKLFGEQLSVHLEPVGALEDAIFERLIEVVWRLRRVKEVEDRILSWEHFGSLAEPLQVVSKTQVKRWRVSFEAEESDLVKEELYYRVRREEIPRLKRTFLDVGKRDKRYITFWQFALTRGRNDYALAKLSRYEGSMERRFYDLLHELQRRQSTRLRSAKSPKRDV